MRSDALPVEKKTIYQASMLAALVALVCVLVMGFVIRSPEPGMSLQPSQPAGPVSDFVRPINQYPDLVLRFLASDTLFVLSYLMVFVGLHATVADRAGAFAAIGLGAGVLAALFDAVENAFFITYALQASNGVTLTQPDLPLIYVVANLKWMGAFAGLYAFGLAWPRDTRLGWVISGLMLLFPLVGALSVAVPGLVLARGVFFLIGMPIFAWHFWQKSRAA
jgi:hypothetical protein